MDTKKLPKKIVTININNITYNIHELTDSDIMGVDGVDVHALVESLKLPSDIKYKNTEEHKLRVWLNNPDSKCPFTYEVLKSLIDTMKRKECEGSSICVHGIKRYICKKCGGSSICVHGRQKTQCKECGGSSLCVHGIKRYRCKKCGGSSICEHGRHKSQCKECGGSSICEHGKQRHQCKTCGSSSFCIHEKRRYQCKKCLAI